MPRVPKPWFREGRGWYVQLNRKQILLGAGCGKCSHLSILFLRRARFHFDLAPLNESTPIGIITAFWTQL